MFSFERYTLNLHAVPFISVGLLVILLGFWVFIRAPREPIHISFLALMGALGLWLGGSGLAFSATDPDVAFHIQKILWVGVLLIAPSVYAFTVTILNMPNQSRRIMWGYAFYVPFLIALPFSLLVSGVHPSPWFSYYTTAGPWEPAFLILFSLHMILSLRLYWHELTYRHHSLRRVRQIRILFVGLLIATVGAFDYIPNFGFTVYTFGYLPLGIYAACIAYAIIRYQLFAVTPQIAAPTIIATMADALLVSDAQGKIAFFNDAAAHLLLDESTPQMNVLSGQPIHKYLRSADVLWERGCKLPQGEQSIVTGLETYLQTQDGQERPVSLSVSFIRTPEGLPAGLAIVAHDLRRARALLKTLRQQKEEFESANRDLKKQTDEADQLNRLVTGRELKFTELKRRLADLERQALMQKNII